MKRAIALALVLLAGSAGAQTVALQGMLGSKALLIVDGSAPKTVAVGDTHMGVKVLSTSGDQATVEVAGKRQTLRVGAAPARVGGEGGGAGGPGGKRIVLSAGSGGHFVTAGAINGRAVQFLVDTGATGVALSEADAGHIGLKYKDGRPVRLSTANGVVQGWRVRLGSLRIADVQVHDVEAIVLPAPMPYVLLGNTFLTRFQMTRENEQLVLERRY